MTSPSPSRPTLLLLSLVALALLFVLVVAAGCASYGGSGGAGRSASVGNGPKSAAQAGSAAGQAFPHGTASVQHGSLSTTTSTSPRPDSSTASPLPGDLLIADRGNARLLVVTPDKRVAWQYRIPGGTGPLTGADDAFFTPDARHVIFNTEYAHWIGIVDIASRSLVWQYGHPGIPGSGAGYLDRPDDAYVRADGTVSVADIRNHRVLFIDQRTKRVVRQYGGVGGAYHSPPTALAGPNGDTPLPDGRTLVTEIGGRWVDLIDRQGHVVWSFQLSDISYPSDAQLLPDGFVLVADYSTPGKVEILSPKGKVVWRYAPAGGEGALSQPSLAIRLSNGNIAVTDDGNHRVVVIDPKTSKIVWQYGQRGVPGSGPGQLHTPDGMDPVPAGAVFGLAH